jgi:hypothetical protein
MDDWNIQQRNCVVGTSSRQLGVMLLLILSTLFIQKLFQHSIEFFRFILIGVM